MIRPYEPGDTDALVDIWRAATAVAHPFLTDAFVEREAHNMRRLYLPKAETWVFEHDGEPAGFIALLGNEIGGLFLAPALHRRGFGRHMVDHAARLHGPLEVEVFEKNAGARTFYARYGFVETGRTRHEETGETVLRLAI